MSKYYRRLDIYDPILSGDILVSNGRPELVETDYNQHVGWSGQEYYRLSDIPNQLVEKTQPEE